MMQTTLDACGLEPGEWFQLAAFRDGNPRFQTFRVGPLDKAEEWVRRRSDCGLYIRGNPLKSNLGDEAARAVDIAVGRVLLFDVDPAKGGVPGDPLDTARECQELVGGTLIDSGRGAQLWIRVRPECQRAQLSRALAARFKRPGVKIDATHDLGRLMRLPGSINHKTGRTARIC